MKFSFSSYVLDSDAFTLTRDGSVLNIEPQVFDFLHFLVQNPGALVTREQLLDAVWGGRIVSESAISARISAVRRAVGDDGARQSIIRTVPRRGIRFVAKVSRNGPAKTLPENPAQRQTIRYATADDAVKIAYAISGSGPALVRIAHYPTHLELEWAEPTERALFDNLGAYRTLVRFDQRGSGLSDIDINDFSVERSADDLKSVADAAGIDRFAIYGSSSGSMIAVQFATKYPERVSHLLLLGGYVDGRSVRNGASDSEEVILKMAQEGWETPNSAFVEGYLSVYFPTATKEQLGAVAKSLQNSCPARNETRGRRFFNHHSIAPLLDRVQAPTLVMHSRQDAVHPLSEAKKMARGIPGAQLLGLDSPNHYPLPQEQCWHEQVAAMRAFLAE